MLSVKMLVLLAVLFFVVSNPMMYERVDGLLSKLGVRVMDEEGPTQLGVALHTVVFLILVVLLQRLKLPAMVKSTLKIA